MYIHLGIDNYYYCVTLINYLPYRSHHRYRAYFLTLMENPVFERLVLDDVIDDGYVIHIDQ